MFEHCRASVFLLPIPFISSILSGFTNFHSTGQPFCLLLTFCKCRHKTSRAPPGSVRLHGRSLRTHLVGAWSNSSLEASSKIKPCGEEHADPRHEHPTVQVRWVPSRTAPAVVAGPPEGSSALQPTAGGGQALFPTGSLHVLFCRRTPVCAPRVSVTSA